MSRPPRGLYFLFVAIGFFLHGLAATIMKDERLAGSNPSIAESCS